MSLIEYGKVPPQAIELEEAVLGSLVNDSTIHDFVIPNARGDFFYNDSHKKIFISIKELYTASKAVDILTLTEKLKSKGELEEIGGPYYIMQLTAKVALSYNAEEHMAIIKQKWIAREIIRISQEATKKAFDSSVDVDDLLSNTQSDLELITKIAIGNNMGSEMEEIMEESVKELDKRERDFREGKPSGVPTGFTKLDTLTGGWQKSDLIILGARPSIGKTAMALHMVKAAAKRRCAVVMFSLEMSKVKLGNRLLLSETKNIDPNKYKHGNFTESDWDDINNAVKELHNIPITIDDKYDCDINRIKSICRVKKAEGKCDLVVIDYLQLMNILEKRGMTRDQAIGKITKQLKDFAKQLDIPIVLIVQLSRKTEERTSKKPENQDIRESGNVENDADIILLLWRPNFYDKDEEGLDNNSGYIICTKNREGAKGYIKWGHSDSMHKIGNPSDFSF